MRKPLFAFLRHSGRSPGTGAGWRRLVPALLLALATSAHAADAPSSLVMEGAELTLVAEPPGPDGRLRAALLIDLAPGWKTYWRDPGDAGIPPALDASGSVNLEPVETLFPLPHRFGDDEASSTGYSQPLAVAFLFQRPDAAAPAAIELNFMLGLCREICIPASGRLRLDPATSGPADARLVAYAFDALPEPSTPQAGIAAARLSADGDLVEVEATVPEGHAGRTADLFVAGPEGWFFGAPKPPVRDGRKLRFEVPVAERPRSAGSAAPERIDALLDLGTKAYRANGIAVGAAR